MLSVLFTTWLCVNGYDAYGFNLRMFNRSRNKICIQISAVTLDRAKECGIKIKSLSWLEPFNGSKNNVR